MPNWAYLAWVQQFRLPRNAQKGGDGLVARQLGENQKLVTEDQDESASTVITWEKERRMIKAMLFLPTSHRKANILYIQALR